LQKQPPEEPNSKITVNPYYSKVLYAQEEILNLQNLGLTDEDAVAVAEALKRNGNISEVDLRIPALPTLVDSNHIGEKGAHAVAESLAFNSAITTLNFGNIR